MSPHSMSASPSIPESGRSRARQSSRSIAAPQVLRVITLSRYTPYPAEVSATDRRGEPFCWTGPSLLSSSLGPASIAPAFYV